MTLIKEEKKWNRFSKKDAYFYVLTSEDYKKENLNEELLNAFFLSGKNHIDQVLKKLDELFGPVQCWGKALDYGCGVGRLVLPLAYLFQEVVGVDISEEMLKETKKNCATQQVENVQLILPKQLGEVRDLDFIHSVIVFQHMPVQEGLKVLKKLLQALKPGGRGALHFNFKHSENLRSKITYFLKYKSKWLNTLSNLLRGRKWDEGFIPMNNYDIRDLMAIFRTCGINDAHVEWIDSGFNNIGVIFYFHKSSSSN